MTMNKAILPAIISALFATSAQAATLYEIDNTAVSLSGEVDAIYKISDHKEQDGELSTWANLQFDITTKVSESVTAISSFEVEGTNGEEVKVDDAWIGFASDLGTVKVGETGSSYEVLEKTELSNELSEYGAGEYSDSQGDGRAVRYLNIVGPIAFSANYSFVEGEDDFALSVDYALDDNFTVGTAYLNGDNITSMGISGSVALDAFYAAAVYTNNDLTAGDFTTTALSTAYTFDLATVYGSYQMKESDSANADLNYWYVGASHSMTANIYAFVEYSDTEADADSEDASAFIAGIYYTF